MTGATEVPPGLRCPLCRGRLAESVCDDCRRAFPTVDVDGTAVLDLRATDVPVSVSLDFDIPVDPISDGLRRRVRAFPAWVDDELTAADVTERYGTKLGDGIRHHLRRLGEEQPGGIALDVGCGTGGNRLFLEELGFRETVGVDWWSRGAQVLADIHRLPFEDQTFDLVLATAVLEHCYLPHLAMREAARVLKPGGTVLMAVSFWERWHSESYFHATPNAIHSLCRQANIDLEDLWVTWGFLPAVASHAVTRRIRRPAYLAERLFLRTARALAGDERTGRHRADTAGAFGFCGTTSRAQRTQPQEREAVRA